MVNHKNAEMGIGTLIIFIALVLVAALAAGVLIMEGGNLQEKALSTTAEEKNVISTNLEVVEVSGTDARDESIDEIYTMYKLTAGSEPVKMDEMLMTESTTNTTVSLHLRKDGLLVNDVFEGYFTGTGYPYPAKETSFDTIISDNYRNTFPAPYTSLFMIGSIAVAVVFPESTDASVDGNLESWTAAEQQAMIDGLVDGINWWSAVEPRAAMEHTFEIYYDIPVDYEPIEYTSANDRNWVNKTLDGMGVDDGATWLVRLRAFNDELRIRNNAHWAFTVFMVDSSNAVAGFGGGNVAGYAYINGPYMAVSSDNMNPLGALFAHEIGHIFGARDEYTGCSCTDGGGYWKIAAGNCDDGCTTNVSSIMRGGQDTVDAYYDDEVSTFVLAQMGLIDQDSNNLLDPIDEIFEGNSLTIDNESVAELARGGYTPGTSSELKGFYTYEFLHTGTNHLDENLQRGDVIKAYHQPGRPITSSEQVRITMIPKSGTAKVVDFVTPEVMTDERIYLYPIK